MSHVDPTATAPAELPDPSEYSLRDAPLARLLRISRLIAQPRFGRIDAAVDARLAALGFLPGALVRIEARAPWGGDPCAVRVGGSCFALRGAEAEKVRVRIAGDS